MADIVLDLPGIAGEATQEGFVGKIAVQSMSLNAAQEVERTKNQTRTIHTVNIEDMSITRLYDLSSNSILDSLIVGKTFSPATIYVLKALNGANAFDWFVKIELDKALIASVNTSFSDSEVTEEITLNFTKITVAYRTQGPDGKLKPGQMSTNFDLQLGKKAA